MARRNPYRAGSVGHARARVTTLKRRATLSRATASRAQSSEARRRLTRRAASAARAVRQIETRGKFRASLNEIDRSKFDGLPITWQEREMRVVRDYPDRVPPDVPDPFAGPYRGSGWRLYYSTRAGIRLRAVA